MAIKMLCRRANVAKVDGGPKGVIVSFRDNAFANPAGARVVRGGAGLVRQGAPGYEDRLHPGCRISDERLKTTAEILRHLARIAERKQAA